MGSLKLIEDLSSTDLHQPANISSTLTHRQTSDWLVIKDTAVNEHNTRHVIQSLNKSLALGRDSEVWNQGNANALNSDSPPERETRPQWVHELDLIAIDLLEAMARAQHTRAAESLKTVDALLLYEDKV